jgi:hypothetical protein
MGELVGIAHVRNALIVAALALFAAPVGAHELGIVQVQATFDGKGAVTVDLLVDPPHLPPVESLGPVSGMPRAVEGLETVSDERVRAFVPLFLSRTTLAFDGLAADLPAAVLAAPDAAASALPGFHPVVVRLAGRVPPGAREFTFRNGLKLGYFVLTLRAPGREPERQWLDGDQQSAPFALTGLAPQKASLAKTLGLYLGLGFTHILPKGFDHVLFVLGLFLLSLRIRPLLLQITAFTIAHTITLGLTIAGVVSLPSTLVEPLIALSIAYVGIENVTTSELKLAPGARLLFRPHPRHGLRRSPHRDRTPKG